MKSCNIRVGYKWKEQYNKWIGINIIWDFFFFIQLASSEPLHVNFFLKKYHATAKY